MALKTVCHYAVKKPEFETSSIKCCYTVAHSSGNFWHWSIALSIMLFWYLAHVSRNHWWCAVWFLLFTRSFCEFL